MYMKHSNSHLPENINQLLLEYLELSQKGTVTLVEETVFHQMIDLCKNEGQSERALRLSEDAITQHPFCAELYLRKAELQLSQHKLAESLVTIQRAEIFAPQNVNVRLLHAELLALQGCRDAALEMLAELKETATRIERSEIHLLEVQIFEDTRRYNDMFNAARSALLADASNIIAYEKIIWATEYTQRFAESIVLHNRLLDKDAYNWRAWLNLGFAYEAEGACAEAIDAFEYAIAIEENCYTAYMEVGELYLKANNYTRALYIYEMAIFKTGDDPLLFQKVGMCYQKLSDIKASKAAFTRALALDTHNDETYYLLGQCEATIGNPLQAIDLYLRAIGINNKKEEYYLALGDAYFQVENYSRAVANYRKAAFTAPDDVHYWVHYASFWLSVGQPKKALKVVEDAEMYAFGVELDYCRIACLLALGRDSEAFYRLNDALIEDFDKHQSLLKWQPNLMQNADFHAIIQAFKL